MCPRVAIVAPERNASVGFPRGRDPSEFSHRLELEPSGARGPCARVPAGAAAAEKEVLSLCGGQVVARGSIPGRYAAS